MVNEYVERRFKEEGLNPAEFLKDNKAFVEGKEKLNVDYKFSTGQTFKATESGGQAKFKILKDGKEIFDLADLAPKDLKFYTPTHWLGAGRFIGDASSGFGQIPEDDLRKIRGKWQRGETYISVGSINSMRNVLDLLHELGHKGADRDIGLAADRGDWEKVAELASKSERDAWANALKMAREVKNKTGVDLLEGFSGDDDIKRYIYTALSSYRFKAESNLSGIPTEFLRNQILGKYGIDPASKNSEWLDKLFDKRKLVRGKAPEIIAPSPSPEKFKELNQASKTRDAKELERARGELKNLMELDSGKK
jgi:hypothetical protein